MGVPSPNTATKILWNTSVLSRQPTLSGQSMDCARRTHSWHQDCSMLLDWHCHTLYHASHPTVVHGKSPRYQTGTGKERTSVRPCANTNTEPSMCKCLLGEVTVPPTSTHHLPLPNLTREWTVLILSFNIRLFMCVCL